MRRRGCFWPPKLHPVLGRILVGIVSEFFPFLENLPDFRAEFIELYGVRFAHDPRYEALKLGSRVGKIVGHRFTPKRRPLFCFFYDTVAGSITSIWGSNLTGVSRARETRHIR